MTIVLLVVICILAICQPTWDRFTVAMLYASMCACHWVACTEFVGFWYYFSAGVFDLAIISVIYAYGARIRLTDDFINICVASIALNFYGWLTWFNYQPPTSYNVAMVALYFIAILSLLRKDCANGKQVNKWHSSVRLFIYKSVAYCLPTQKESQP